MYLMMSILIVIREHKKSSGYEGVYFVVLEGRQCCVDLDAASQVVEYLIVFAFDPFTSFSDEKSIPFVFIYLAFTHKKISEDDREEFNRVTFDFCIVTTPLLLILIPSPLLLYICVSSSSAFPLS